jgi:hypothetical protein
MLPQALDFQIEMFPGQQHGGKLLKQVLKKHFYENFVKT